MLPGQYYDQETGLHYNYFRYYAPETGRYITSDPLGLFDGLNTYAYVSNNPVSEIDPFSLCGFDSACLYRAKQAAQAMKDAAKPSQKTINKFKSQLEKDGGYTSSIEREMRGFANELEAIKKFARKGVKYE